MHHASGSTGGLEAWESDLIHHEVRSFINGHTFRWSDADDLFQDCAEAWLKVGLRYDDTRGASRKTFMKEVVRNKLRDQWRAERTESRSALREAFSLDAPMVDEDGETTAGDRVKCSEEDIADRAVTNADIIRLAAGLSPREREVLKGFLNGIAVPTLATRLGVHRDTIYADRVRIQKAFAGWAERRSGDPTNRPSRS